MPTTTYLDVTHAIAAIYDRTDAAGAAIQDLPGEDARLWASLFSEGVVKPADGFQVKLGTGMQVVIGSGTAYTDVAVVKGETPRQGNYIVRLDQASPSLTVPAANPSLARRDEVYLVVSDKGYGSPPPTLGVARLSYRTGDAASSPSAPGPDAAWEAWLLLGEVSVPAGAVNPTLIDRRPTADVAASGGSVPVGAILPYAGAAAPTGWLLCSGQAVTRVGHPRLFAAIGTVYGTGDGSTTFNVPNLQGRFPLGKNPDAGEPGDVLAETGGDWETENATHTHVGKTTSTVADHKHVGLEVKSGGGTAIESGGAISKDGGIGFEEGSTKHAHNVNPVGHTHDLDWSAASASAGGHSHTVADYGPGGGHQHDFAPPYLTVNYIIRAA